MIKIESDLFSFESEDHLVVWGANNGLCFDSATYKSYLFKQLVMLQNSDGLSSNLNLILEDRPKNAAGLTITEKDCLIIDELNYAPGDLNVILEKVRNANAHLIAIGRMFIKQFEYSVDAVYSFAFTGKERTVRFEKTFRNVPQAFECPGVVACEDSAPVAMLYALSLDTDVIPAFGRSRFYPIIKNSAVALVIADKPKFGQDLLGLLYRLQSAEVKTLLVFCPECFEEIVCEICHVDLKKYKVSDFFDAEYYFEEAAKSIPDWNKNKLAKSIETLIQQQYQFEQSDIMQELKKFYEKESVAGSTRCYAIHKNDFNYARFSEDCLNEWLAKGNK